MNTRETAVFKRAFRPAQRTVEHVDNLQPRHPLILPLGANAGLFTRSGVNLGTLVMPEYVVNFAARLRAGNPEWGCADMDDLGALAERVGLRLTEAVPMLANKFVLVFTRGA